jgi:peptide/nickel transport system ATP-binding protein
MSTLECTGLSVRGPDGALLLAPLDLAVAPGTVLVLLGESGAGKSLVCGAIAGTLPAELRVEGRVALGGRDIGRLPSAARRALWARSLFLLPQEPWQALAPTRSIAAQTADMPRLHQGARGRTAGGIAAALLRRLGLPVAAHGAKRPAQLSGGMAQRAAFAAALGAPAPLVLVDEPTKGLDAALRDRVGEHLALLRDEGRALVVVTHDLALARALGGETIVMRDGRVVERGPTEAVFATPRAAFTRALLAADPAAWRFPRRPAGAIAASLRGVTITAGARGPALVRGFDLDLARGSVVGLVGPSGAGKTSIGDTLLRLRQPAAGTVTWANPARRAHQKLFQDPGAAFAPWRPIGATVADALHQADAPRERLSPLLHRLGLAPRLLQRRPAQVSGGELQRIALARALLCAPELLFADEPTSRLDPITQARTVALLRELVEEQRLALLLVSHDKALVEAAADRIVALPASGSPAAA